MPGWLRWTVLAVPAAVLFAVALNGDVYNATSPPGLGMHVVLRKFYSVVAFTVVGLAYVYARRSARVLDVACAVALYSGAIEIGQWFVSHEPLEWNLIDVACGGAGGVVAAVIARRWGVARGR